MEAYTVDITDLEVDSEDIILSFVDCLISEGFEEQYVADTFELDDIILQIYDHDTLIIDCGLVDDAIYVTLPNDQIQYFNAECVINIVTEFTDLCKEYK